MDLKVLFQQILNIVKKLNKQQKIVIVGTLIAVVAFIAFLVVYNSKTTTTADGYKVLFEKVSTQDSALIIQQLQQDQIPYRISNEETILVPEESVYEQRIKLASLGLPKSSTVGFELFDQQEFGATDFDQKIKFLRALEGELSRTIASLNPIEEAKVHLALPKESVFVTQAAPPTASVVITLLQNMILTPKQIMGIKNLVAASVTNLNPEDVKIVNENGEPLGGEDDLSASKELAAAQMRYKHNFERTLEEKIIKILSPVVGGESRVVAKVTMEFDFSQKESTKEVFDPNNVVRSEQTLEEKREGFKPKEIGGVPGAVSNIGPVQGLDENDIRDKYEKSQTTTNFEVSKTVSSIKGEFAEVRRISAAVVVDGKYELSADGEIEQLQYVALSEAQLTSISNLVKQAIGFSEVRGDQVTVSNFEFDAKTTTYKPKTQIEKVMETIERFIGPFMPLLKYVLVAIILFIFYKKIIVPFAERMLAVHTDDEDDVDSLFDIDDEDDDQLNRFSELRRKVEDQLGIGSGISEDEIKYDVLLEKMKALVEEKPEEIATLFATLIRDELGIDEPAPDFSAAAKNR